MGVTDGCQGHLRYLGGEGGAKGKKGGGSLLVLSDSSVTLLGRSGRGYVQGTVGLWVCGLWEMD